MPKRMIAAQKSPMRNLLEPGTGMLDAPSVAIVNELHCPVENRQDAVLKAG